MLIDKVGDSFYATQQVFEMVCCCRYSRDAPYIIRWGSRYKTDSGLGCGRNWPDCNGSLIPKEITPEVLIEFSHRLVTGVVSISILVLTIWTWRKLGHIREVKLLGFLAMFFLIAQALIGAAQVLWGQGDFILALHFGISLISFAAVLLLSMIVFEVDRKFDADNVFIGKSYVGIQLLSQFILI